MKIALAQMQMSASMEENYQKSLQYIGEAAGHGAELILFPEIQLTPFFPQYEGQDASKYVMTFEDEYVRGLQRACREHQIFASPNFYMEENGRRYDMSLLIDDAGVILGNQKMVHVARCPMFYEQDYYTPSEEGFHVFDTKLGRIGIVVCFDRHYPESIRTSVAKGTDVVLIPTANTTGEPAELFAWEVRIQAFQSSVYVAMCNRVGTEGAMEFSGESLVADYEGRVMAKAGAGETLLYAQIEPEDARAARERKPYTALLRPELYR